MASPAAAHDRLLQVDNMWTTCESEPSAMPKAPHELEKPAFERKRPDVFISRGRKQPVGPPKAVCAL